MSSPPSLLSLPPSAAAGPLGSSPVSLTAMLRGGTADQHRRLDEGLSDLVGAQVGTARYTNVLEALFGFYVPFEDRLVEWVRTPQLASLPLVLRATLLARDLQARDRALDPIPKCLDLPALTTVDRVAGALYVVEGACLGGQVIARAVKQRLRIEPHNGAAFFTGAGADTGARWKRFVSWLDQPEGPAWEPDEVVAGARGTFAALTAWLLARGVLGE